MSYAVTLVHGGAAYHWVLWDIPASTTSLGEGVERMPMPTMPMGVMGSKQTRPGLDASTWFGYTGPCPQGAQSTYVYTVYAVKVASLPGVTPMSAGAAVQAAITANMLAKSSLTALAP
jgi:phosphatidylethanolamine-binding protein (PEBP) family uncharacterized protein